MVGRELRSSQGPNKESIVTWVRTCSGWEARGDVTFGHLTALILVLNRLHSGDCVRARMESGGLVRRLLRASEIFCS